MKRITLKKSFLHIVSVLLVFVITFQMVIPMSYAADKETAFNVKSVSLKDELSKNGNVVTEYVNDEDKQTKTILWAKGIKPPKMGGEDSQFKKQLTYDSKGNVSYIDYIAPYAPGNGWYDVNKSKDFVLSDMNLCFAAAASNSLHWWLDQNSDYIDKYLQMNPNDAQIQKLNYLRSSFENQQKSGIYDIYLRQFANKQDGYYPDILQDQFINGYYPKPNGGTNDSPADRDKLKNNGPDKNGGFFYKVFDTERLTDRRYYDNGFDTISKELKELFLNGDSVLMTFSVGPKSHVVTLWGAEFDQNGTISAVYYSDSDDEANQGMMRYRVFNVDGKAVVTTQVNGKSNSVIQCLQILSRGTSQWENYLGESKKTLDLVWDNTETIYNGKLQAPTVSATNIEAGDDITLTVKGGEINSGVYTATVVLSGASADKYKLPENNTHTFVIKKAPAPQITFPVASALQYGQKLMDSTLIGGSVDYGNFLWDDTQVIPTVSNTGYKVKFVPSDLTLQNYEKIKPISYSIPILVSKSTPNITISSNVKHTLNSSKVTFSAKLDSVGYGETPTGSVEFIVTDDNGNVVFDSGKNNIKNGIATVTWNNAKYDKFTVKAKYSGSENYNSVFSDNIIVDIRKETQDGFKIKEIGTKVYGDGEFILETIGGSGNGKITFESSDSSVISIIGNKATIKKAGKVTIVATKDGDEVYNSAKDSIEVLVNKKDLIISADNISNIVQGDSMPEFTYTINGLVYNDKFSNPTITSPAKNTNNAGEYEIYISGGELTNADSYSVTYVNGILSIEEKQTSPIVPPVIKPDFPLKPTNKPVVHSNDNVSNTVEDNAVHTSKPTDSETAANPADIIENTTSETVTNQNDVNKDNELDEVKTEDTKEEHQEKDNTNIVVILVILLILAAIVIISILVYQKRKKID